MLDPELALTLFVAPVLLDAAFDASPRDLRANWRRSPASRSAPSRSPSSSSRWWPALLVPDMPWAAAIALGAIVAPPDAAAATAVLKQLRPPHRLLVILEGESLFNDASALLVYRLAVGATLAGALSPASVVPMLLVVTVGSVVLGFVLSRVILPVNARIQDVATAVVVQFCGTFAVWMLAERLHLSGILTVVVFAMATPAAPRTIPARIRIPSYAVWEFAVFVLNVLAFILVGFQLKGILGRIDRSTLLEYAGVAVAVCVATILARIAWVSGAAAFSRWRCRPAPDGSAGAHDRVGLSKRAAAVVGWCGMRGIVTLAAALALPTGGAGGPAFPYRDLDPVHGVLGRARDAGGAGDDAAAAHERAEARGRRLGGARGEARARRDAARRARGHARAAAARRCRGCCDDGTRCCCGAPSRIWRRRRSPNAERAGSEVRAPSRRRRSCARRRRPSGSGCSRCGRMAPSATRRSSASSRSSTGRSWTCSSSPRDDSENGS